MHFGIFIEELRHGSDEATWFRETFELVEAAEAWGIDGVWLGEIHFNPGRSVLSSPIALAGFIAARTRRVRVGTAIQVLPLSNPLRIAEDVATIDHLSEGRFDFGIGRSGSPRAYDALGIPYAESQARFQENLAVILQAWKGERFSFEGKFYRFQNVAVSPRPVQRPHPPLRMAANSRETFPFVGRAGLPLFVGVRDLDIPELRVHLQTYRKAWRDAGHPGDGDVCLRLPVYAAPSEREALDEPRENITYFYRRHAELTRSGLGRADTGPEERRRTLSEKVDELTYEEILRTRVAFGTAAGLIDRIAQVRDELGLTGVVAELNPGGLLPMERMQRTLRVLTHEVMPAFR
ncbi:MAG TPA: LLM class flavin-dependent oxidoreductase [Candidatus Binatia bacterium]|nr:LLM class flavin-dependent oxidoreductase [Candidatus Binatia bacterium]